MATRILKIFLRLLAATIVVALALILASRFIPLHVYDGFESPHPRGRGRSRQVVGFSFYYQMG